MPAESHRVVVIGGGFGGLHATRALRKAPVQITLVDRHNYHLFQPLLYQVATGQLSPANIASPLRAILSRQENAAVLQANVTDFDLANKQVIAGDDKLPYDSLIVAAGARSSYFGHDWESKAPGLKSIEDALEIRAQVLSAFERAEWEEDPVERQRLLTFVVVGGGPTGVELSGALSELSRHTLRREFRRIKPEDARIMLIDGGPRVLSTFVEPLSEKAKAFLNRLGVTVRNGEIVSEIGDGHVVIKQGDNVETIETETILWAAGVQASPLAQKLADAAGVQITRGGHIPVDSADLTVEGYPDVFVIGDMACCMGENDKPLPGVAPVAVQQGQHVAKMIGNRLEGKKTEPFKYRDKGSLATVGRSAAVADIFGLKFAGFFAWLMWLFVHLMLLVAFENRVLVFVQWTWSYMTHGRTARLITNVHERQPEHEEQPT